MASSTRSGDDIVDEGIHLTREGEWWAAKGVGTGVAGQGETRQEALEMLDEAVALHRGEIGIDPDEVESTKGLPDFVK